LLIDAFKYALTVNPSFHHCRLKIVGDGPLYNELAAYIEVHQLSNYVTLLGYKANVNTLIEQAHVFVLSSVYEAMPMTILEAMAVKRPVICTKVGGIPKFLDESQVAFVESDNCEQLAKTMLDYFEHYDQKKTIVDKAYRIVSEKYSIATMCEYYLALYQVRKNILQ
jgi:glycosyltransferase involved in cell wall biosynthesis